MNETEQALILGRLEGKVDAIMAGQSVTAARVDGIDRRLGALDSEVAALRAAGTSGKQWLSYIFSAGAVGLSALTFLSDKVFK